MKKNILYTLAAIFLMLACKNKPETENHTKIDKVAENAYLKDIVGVMENGKYAVNNAAIIMQHWNNKLKKDNIEGVLTELEIVKAKMEADPGVNPDTFYILVAKSEDKKTKVAAFLISKNDNLYFELQDKVLNLTICQGCVDGCNPGVSAHEGVKLIMCSPCLECMKGNIEVN